MTTLLRQTFEEYAKIGLETGEKSEETVENMKTLYRWLRDNGGEVYNNGTTVFSGLNSSNFQIQFLGPLMENLVVFEVDPEGVSWTYCQSRFKNGELVSEEKTEGTFSEKKPRKAMWKYVGEYTRYFSEEDCPHKPF